MAKAAAIVMANEADYLIRSIGALRRRHSAARDPD